MLQNEKLNHSYNILVQRSKRILKMRKYVIFFIFVCFIVTSCTNKKTKYYIGEAERAKTVLIENERNHLTREIDKEIAVAVDANDIKLVERLCKANPEIISRSYEGEKYYSILHYAIVRGKEKSVKKLLELGMNPNLLTKDGVPPLIYAINGKYLISNIREDFSPEIINDLINFEADTNFIFESKSLIMHFIINWSDEESNVQTFNLLLKKSNLDINMEDSDSYTALDHAFGCRKINFIYALLVENNAKVKAEINYKCLNDESKIETINPTSVLRELLFEKDSEKYKTKKKVIDKLESYGFDYRNEPIPTWICNLIKIIYKDEADFYFDNY